MVFGSGGDASYCAALPLASGFSLPHARSIKQPSFLYIAMAFGLFFLGGVASLLVHLIPLQALHFKMIQTVHLKCCNHLKIKEWPTMVRITHTVH